MARTKSSESIESKIKKAQHKVEYCKENYDRAISELESLHKEQKELQMKLLFFEIEKSGKSIEEVLRYVKNSKS